MGIVAPECFGGQVDLLIFGWKEVIWMAKFQRSTASPAEETYSIGLNVILSGSKKMEPEQVEALLSTGSVRVTIVDVENPDRILVDEVIEAKEFKTGSVGFGLHTRGLKFQGK